MKERYPSGQREQTVNLPAQPTEVRILPSPPVNPENDFLIDRLGKIQGVIFLFSHKSLEEWTEFNIYIAGIAQW